MSRTSPTAGRRPAGRRPRPRPSRSKRWRRNRAVAGVLVLLVAVLVWWSHSGPPEAPACAVAEPNGGAYTLSPTQAQNASIIAAVATRKNLPDHAVTVALAAALQESKLVDLDHGDRDSLGLFQQRPSQGWGTPAQILDPVYATTAFLDKLAHVPGWETASVTDAAQAVQASAAPDAYAAWEPEARTLAAALTGETPAALGCRFPAFAGPPPPIGALQQAAQTEFGSSPLGIPVDAKKGWAVAAWAVAHAYQYHVMSVTFAGRSWEFSADVWRTAAVTAPVVSVQG